MSDNEPPGPSVAGASAGNATWDEDEQQMLYAGACHSKIIETLLSAPTSTALVAHFQEAMHYALENLLVYGDERDLMALEEW
jgi:hypothetical protein